MIKIFSILIGIALLSSCSTYSDEQKNEFDSKIESYLKNKDIKCEKSDSGLYFKILDAGEGNLIQYKDVVSFTYTAHLLNGKLVDQKKEPIEYPVEELIGAWKEIMLKLRPGGKAYLVAPPQLGYGEHKLDEIPPNSILVFEMAVVEVK